MRSTTLACTGKIRSTPWPKLTLRTVMLSPMPMPLRAINTPSKAWRRSFSPSLILTCTLMLSPGRNSGNSFSRLFLIINLANNAFCMTMSVRSYSTTCSSGDGQDCHGFPAQFAGNPWQSCLSPVSAPWAPNGDMLAFYFSNHNSGAIHGTLCEAQSPQHDDRYGPRSRLLPSGSGGGSPGGGGLPRRWLPFIGVHQPRRPCLGGLQRIGEVLRPRTARHDPRRGLHRRPWDGVAVHQLRRQFRGRPGTESRGRAHLQPAQDPLLTRLRQRVGDLAGGGARLRDRQSLPRQGSGRPRLCEVRQGAVPVGLHHAHRRRGGHRSLAQELVRCRRKLRRYGL